MQMPVRIIFCLLSLILAAQCAALGQHIRGTVTSLVAGRPLAHCFVQLKGGQHYEAFTDSAGTFELLVEPGKYEALFYKEGFAPLHAGAVQVLSAKQYVMEIQLREAGRQLDTVTVQEEHAANGIRIEVWDSQRMPAVFYDPARVVTSWAGVLNTDDQANNVSVHGASPDFVQWRLEGVEIVNPNHLENAGTPTDRAATNGGGVSLLSAQLLQGSSFRFAPFQPAQGNALAGLFDMRFRTGNNERSERIIQAGLLGTDICLEGPLSKNHSASYLVNYRYSTVGLLTQLGVDFGEERINYHDLSLVAAIPLRKGWIRLFGAGGQSANDYSGETDTALVETQKQLQDISYRSATGIVGASYLVPVNSSTLFRAVGAYSAKQVTRKADPTIAWPGIGASNELQTRQKLSAVFHLSKSFRNRVLLKGGAFVNYFISENDTREPGNPVSRLAEGIVQPFIAAEQIAVGRAGIMGGLHVFLQPRLGFVDLQPRAELNYRVSESQQMTLYLGRSAQLQNAGLYLQAIRGEELKPALSNAAALAYRLRAGRVLCTPRIFYHYYTNLAANDSFYFSSFNYINEQVAFSLDNSGKARSYGIEATVQAGTNGWSLLASATAFNSEYSTRARVYREARFNARFNLVVNAGKELKLKNSRRILGVYLKYMWRDGFLEGTPESVYLYNSRLPAYYRIDARLSLQSDKTRITTLLALDVQNVSNRKNVAYHYQDLFTSQTETRHQLGIVPVISYKIFF